jgi:ABC-type dipeptide/oligopeptide/nickel transport system permease subunit
MAFEHSLLYGIMAVVIAVFAGLFMGVIFKDRGGAH